MAIHDFLVLIRRNLKIMLAFPIVFIVVAIAWSFFTQTNYTATSSFVTNGDVAFAQGLANSQAASYSNSEVRITCSSQTAAKQISINATGTNADVCIEAANAVANATVKQYKEANNTIIATVTEARYAVSDGSSMLEILITAFVAGILLAVCVILLIAFMRAPIKSPSDIESVSGLPVLGHAPSPEGGERLLANLQFRNNGRPSTVAIVPVGAASAASIVARELAGALERSDIRVKLVKGSPHAKKFQVSVPEDAAIVVSCESLDDGMGAAYIAHNADATIICATEWTDSKKQLVSTVQELDLAKANIAGAVIISEEKKQKKPRDEKQS